MQSPVSVQYSIRLRQSLNDEESVATQVKSKVMTFIPSR
jgi:hypothetical protein